MKTKVLYIIEYDSLIKVKKDNNTKLLFSNTKILALDTKDCQHKTKSNGYNLLLFVTVL